MPLGRADLGLDLGHVTGLGLNVEAFNREGEAVAGQHRAARPARDLRAGHHARGPWASSRPSCAGEAERSAGMQARLNQRCGLRPGQMAVGVNLAWPTADSPDGEPMQLYGRILDGGTPWYNRLWDVGEQAVAMSVRNDFREIRETFGPGAVVRLWLFSDLRSGLALDGEGDPVAVTERASQNMHGLLRMAAEEQVVLLPVLLDFQMADGVVRTGPDGAWQVSERPELITDPRRRVKLVKALEDFVRLFAGNPAVLAWDVMNEPENAAGVVTPAHFGDAADLRLRAASRRSTAPATSPPWATATPSTRAIHFRGRVASDLGQAHYYPLVDTRPNPTPFDLRWRPSSACCPPAGASCRPAPAASPPSSPPPSAPATASSCSGAGAATRRPATATPSNPTPPRSARPWASSAADRPPQETKRQTSECSPAASPRCPGVRRRGAEVDSRGVPTLTLRP